MNFAYSKVINFFVFGPEMTETTHGLSLPEAPSCRVFVREVLDCL